VPTRSAIPASSAYAVLAPSRSPAPTSAHEQIQPRRSIGAIVRHHVTQIARPQIRRGSHVAAIECDFRLSERRQRVRLRLIEKRRSLHEPSLPASKLGEAHLSVRRHCGPAGGELLGRGHELLLLLEPGAAPHADRGVLRAADGEEHAQPPFRAELLQPRAPLHRAVVVAHAIAGGNHVARQTDGDQILELAGEDRRIHFIERPHALGHGAGGDEREAADRATEHLEIDAARGLRGADALGRVLERAVRIAVLEQCERARAALEPRALRTLALVLEQPTRALQPAVRNGALAAKRPQ
jgi:hypothetical protein